MKPLKPFLHELVTTLAAPTLTMSAPSGDIDATGGLGSEFSTAHGILHADVRVVSGLTLTVNGHRPEHIATRLDASSAKFTSIARRVESDSIAEPQLRLDRHRQVAPGLITEAITVTNRARQPLPIRLEARVRPGFDPMEKVRSGHGAPSPHAFEVSAGEARWGQDKMAVGLNAKDASITEVGAELILAWELEVPAEGSIARTWQLTITDSGGAVTAAATSPLAVADSSRRLAAAAPTEHRLEGWLQQSLADLNALRMATAAAPDEPFYAAGAPWFLTLFGRDSIWAARFALPVDHEMAVSTLRTLARLQGTTVDPITAEEPGKIMHELRRENAELDHLRLPPLYYGTIDATPLWISLLHDAWVAGMNEDAVRELLPQLELALAWLNDYGDADGDGFLEYIDMSGKGLANQGWKDSDDAVRFADGHIASGPVALCEVQGYAHEAAIAGAAILDAFGRPGGDRWRTWAADLADRFRAQFWCGEGAERYPALALDGDKGRVDSVTSNIGHLLGTGILSAEEERLVAQRVTASDLDSGLGLRTMSSKARGYDPLSYHCGSVWPHDTAIVIRGLIKAGVGNYAGGLIEGLLRASTLFDQRLPELWSGEGEPVPYSTACRPQAWAAAASLVVADALAR